MSHFRTPIGKYKHEEGNYLLIYKRKSKTVKSKKYSEEQEELEALKKFRRHDAGAHSTAVPDPGHVLYL